MLVVELSWKLDLIIKQPDIVAVMLKFLPLASVLAIIYLTSFSRCGATVTSSTSSYNVNQNSNTETVKIGNSKTKNYNIGQSNFTPTQMTQVVLNVPKLNKKLRKTRPPTREEFAIKKKIVEIYNQARQNLRYPNLQMEHLGRVLQALNPKYIATERVKRVAFSDPLNPLDVEPPWHDDEAITLKLSPPLGPVDQQLDVLDEKFRELVHWDQQFAELLAVTEDGQLTATQLAYKQLLLCLSQPTLCQYPRNLYQQSAPESDYEQPMVSARADAEASYQRPEVSDYVQSPQVSDPYAYQQSQNQELDAWQAKDQVSQPTYEAPTAPRTVLQQPQTLRQVKSVSSGSKRSKFLPKNLRFVDQKSSPKYAPKMNYRGY